MRSHWFWIWIKKKFYESDKLSSDLIGRQTCWSTEMNRIKLICLKLAIAMRKRLKCSESNNQSRKRGHFLFPLDTEIKIKWFQMKRLVVIMLHLIDSDLLSKVNILFTDVCKRTPASSKASRILKEFYSMISWVPLHADQNSRIDNLIFYTLIGQIISLHR